jgi:ribosomal protein S18 acetylase RimI-like enzyme
MAVTVSIARSEDTALVDALNRLLPQLTSNAVALTPEAVAAIVTSDGSTLFVARDGDDIVGVLTLVVYRVPTGVKAWIEDVVVDEAARGRGVGEALTRAALDEATANGIRTVDLTSRPAREAAHRLYQKLGFATRDTSVYRHTV